MNVSTLNQKNLNSLEGEGEQYLLVVNQLCLHTSVLKLVIYSPFWFTFLVGEKNGFLCKVLRNSKNDHFQILQMASVSLFSLSSTLALKC